MELHAGIVHHLADVGHVFGSGIVAARLAACARVLVEHQAAAKVGAVLRLEHACVGRVKAGRDVGGQHGRSRQGAAQRERPALAGKLHHLGDGVLEELRRHAGGAYAADLLLVDQHAHARAIELFAGHGKLRHHRRVGADTVVLAVSQHHGTVEAQIARAAGGHNLQLGRQEVLFLHAVLFVQQLKGEGLDRILLGRGLLAVGILAFAIALALGAVLAHHQRAVPHQDVERLALDDLVRLLAHLGVRQMDQQIRHAKNRVIGIFADFHVDDAAVLLRHDAVQRQRDGDPLVMLDAAIVMRVQKGEIVRLVQRVLLHVQTRAVDVRAQDVHALCKRPAAQLYQDDGLAAHRCPHFVAAGKFATCGNSIFKAFVTGGFGAADGSGGKLALRLVLGDEVDVSAGELLELGELVFVIAFPGRFAFHMHPFASALCL